MTEQEAFGRKVIHMPNDFLIMLQMIENIVIKEDYVEKIEPSSQEISQKYKNQRADSHSIQNIAQIIYDSSKGIWLNDEQKITQMLLKYDKECRHYFEEEIYYSQTYKDLFLIIIEKLFFMNLVEALDNLVTYNFYMVNEKKQIQDVLDDYNDKKFDFSFEFIKAKSFKYTNILFNDKEVVNETTVNTLYNKYNKIIMKKLKDESVHLLFGDYPINLLLSQ